MRIVWIISLLACATDISTAQNIVPIEVKAGHTVEIKGNLADGQPMETLRWAWNSSVACFPETQKEKFNGNHRLYIADLPKYSEMEVTVIPKDQTANFSLYAYEIGQLDENNQVPNLESCIRCEADHKWDAQYKGKTQDHTRTVKNLVAINNPYQVVIGVTGANGLQAGEFSLKITLKSR